MIKSLVMPLSQINEPVKGYCEDHGAETGSVCTGSLVTQTFLPAPASLEAVRISLIKKSARIASLTS